MASPYFLGCDLSIPTYSWRTSAGADNVNTSFPVTNLQTYFASDVSKSNSTAGDQYFLIDFGSAVACNTIVLDGTNFASVGVGIGIYLQTNTNDDTTWTDANTTVEITQTSSTQIKTFSSETKRYWRIFFTDSIGGVAPQIGNVFLGTRLTFESTYEWDFARANKAFETTETSSLNGNIRMSQVFAGRLQFDLNFRLQSNTLKTALDTFMNTVRGKLRPFFFLDVDGTSLYYVHLANDYNEVKGIRYNQNNIRIQLKTQQAY